MMPTGDLALFARTAARLRPGQVTQRVRLRAQRLALHHVPAVRRWLLAGPDPALAAGWPADFTPVDAGVWREWARTGHAAGGPDRVARADHGRSRRRPPDYPAAMVSGPGDSDTTEVDRRHTDWAIADWDQAGAPLLWRFHLHYWDWAWALAAER